MGLRANPLGGARVRWGGVSAAGISGMPSVGMPSTGVPSVPPMVLAGSSLGAMGRSGFPSMTPAPILSAGRGPALRLLGSLLRGGAFDGDGVFDGKELPSGGVSEPIGARGEPPDVSSEHASAA